MQPVAEFGNNMVSSGEIEMQMEHAGPKQVGTKLLLSELAQDQDEPARGAALVSDEDKQ